MGSYEPSSSENLLLERIAHLEEEMGKLTGILEEGKGLLDQAIYRSENQFPVKNGNGIVLERRLSNALHLAERLTAPAAIDKFDQLLEASALIPDLFTTLQGIGEDIIRQIPPEGLQLDERLNAIATLAGRLTDPARVARLNKLLDLMDAAPDLLETVGSVVQDVLAQAQSEGFRLDERVGAILPLLDRLTTPQTVERLQELLDLVETAPDLIHTVQGMATDVLAQFPAESLRLDERVQAALPVLDKLSEPKVLAKLNLLLTLVERIPAIAFDPESEDLKKAFDCEINLPRILNLVSTTGAAFCEVAKEEPRRMSLTGMIAAPFDKDRQVAIGFLMTFLKKFGQKLQASA